MPFDQTMTMDTLTRHKALIEGGLKDPGAETVARAIGDGVKGETDKLVTKDQLQSALSELKLQLILSQVAIAGLSLAIARLIFH